MVIVQIWVLPFFYNNQNLFEYIHKYPVYREPLKERCLLTSLRFRGAVMLADS